MDIEAIIKLLGLEGDEAEKLRVKLTAEQTKFDKKVEQLNGSITKLKEDIKTKGSDNDTATERLTSVLELLDVDADSEDFDTAVQDAIESIRTEAGKATPEDIKKLQRELTKAERANAKLKKEHEEVTKTLEDEKGRRQNEVKRREIVKVMKENNIINPEELADLFILKAKVNDDDSLTILDSDGTELAIADAISDWAESHTEFVDSNQAGGAGGGTGGGAGGVAEQSLLKEIIDGQQKSNTSEDLNKFFE